MQTYELAKQHAADAVHRSIHSTWSWFNTLTREEWLIVLAVGCAAGFFCMRGLGTRRQF